MSNYINIDVKTKKVIAAYNHAIFISKFNFSYHQTEELECEKFSMCCLQCIPSYLERHRHFDKSILKLSDYQLKYTDSFGSSKKKNKHLVVK